MLIMVMRIHLTVFVLIVLGGKRLNITALPSAKLPTEVAERSAWDIVCGGELLNTSTTASDCTAGTENCENNRNNSISGNETNDGDTVTLVEALEEPVEDGAKETTVHQSGNIDNDRTIGEKVEPYHCDGTIAFDRDYAVSLDVVEDQEQTQTYLQPNVKEAMDCIKQSEAMTLSDLLISDKDVRIWTGLQTLALLQEICLAVRKLEDVVTGKNSNYMPLTGSFLVLQSLSKIFLSRHLRHCIALAA